MTVTPVDDNDSGNESVTVTASVTSTINSGYQGETGSVAVTVTDNEVGLAASAVKETTATLTISNHTAAWWYKGNQTNASCTSVAANTATADLTNLTGGTAYTYKAYSDNACTTEITSASTDAEFSMVGLTATPVAQTTATLNLANWTSAWWHKKTVPATPAGTCAGVAANTATASLASLTAGTAHTWEVYSATGCNAADKIADVSFTTAATITLTASAVTETTATLTIANHTGDWYHKRTTPTGGTCSSAVSAATASLTNLTGGTAYTWKAYSDSGCATEIASETFSTVGLSAGSLTQTTATLTLSNWTQAWWHKKTVPATPAGTCVSVAANTLTASLTSLTSGTAHTWEVYSAAGCASTDKIADVDFTTTAAPTLAASAVKETTATLTISNHTAAWWYKGNQTNASCTSVAANTATASLTGLTGGTSYTYKAYSASGCNATDLIATSAAFSTVGLTATSVTQTTATLNLSNWTAAWWHKKTVPATPAGTCAAVDANTATASLTSLAAGTAHTWEVYSATGCNSADRIADVAFTTTAAVSLAASNVKETTATLTISNHTAEWWYKDDSLTLPCISVARNTASVDLSGLTGGTSYTYKAYSDGGCTTEITTDSTDAEFSTVGLVGAGARSVAGLLLTNWKAAWWHKKTSGPGTATCTPVAVGISSVNLTGLTRDKTYTWEAYSAEGCNASDEIADVDFVTGAAWLSPAGGTTETTANLVSSYYASPWWYKRTAPTGDSTCHSVAAYTSVAHLSGLTGNTRYTYKAYGDSSCTAEITDDLNHAEFLTVGLAATSVTQTTATLTLSNWAAGGSFKKTSGPGTATCEAVSTNASAIALSNLTANSSYTWTFYSDLNCTPSNKVADVDFTATASVSLSASAVKETTATLDISNHAAAWWYQGNQTNASCTLGGGQHLQCKPVRPDRRHVLHLQGVQRQHLRH